MNKNILDILVFTAYSCNQGLAPKFTPKTQINEVKRHK